MAFLTDGGFTGFLYSMKETGRRLANGAKQVVEDFVSGFNGHGWKIWKSGDSWKMEIDELTVRKSLNAFELIISQVRAIKGSQAITQGNAKIKSVTTAMSDVYKETETTLYITDFDNTTKWNDANNLKPSDHTIDFIGGGNIQDTKGLYITPNTTIEEFKVNITGIKKYPALNVSDFTIGFENPDEKCILLVQNSYILFGVPLNSAGQWVYSLERDISNDEYISFKFTKNEFQSFPEETFLLRIDLRLTDNNQLRDRIYVKPDEIINISTYGYDHVTYVISNISGVLEILEASDYICYQYNSADNTTQKTGRITTDGEYIFPKHYSSALAGTFGLLFNVGKESHIVVDEISTTSGYNESIEKNVPCFRIEIEEELNTLTEYDIIRCQKGDKFYHVQIGSVFQYYINIPISEFSTDPETGAIMNSPMSGDEIVQFGNASHQDKYANRHSAIYMHLDGNEPAIDLMTDIYSKDWSQGNIIKTRIGGNLPGTNGDRGFYCVNGKIMSVDEKGETVYVINPDGSASFARGKLFWTKDGSPFFQGHVISGDYNGKRVEINPTDGKIVIYNEKSFITNTFESQYYDNPNILFDKRIPNYTFLETDQGIDKRTDSTGKFSSTYNSPIFNSNIKYIEVENTEDEYVFYFSSDFSYVGSGLSLLYLKYSIILEKEDGTYIELDKQEYSNVNYGGTSQTGATPYPIPKEIGKYTPKIRTECNITGTPNYGRITTEVIIKEAYVKNNTYKSSFFSKGIGFGTNPDNTAMIWDKNTDGDLNNGMRFVLSNNNAGIKMNSRNVFIKYKYFENTPAYWFYLQPLLFWLEISSDGTIQASQHTGKKEDDFTCVRSSTGTYDITVPQSVSKMGGSTDPACHVLPTSVSQLIIGYGYYNGGGSLNVRLYNSTGLVNNGFKLLVYGLPSIAKEPNEYDTW